MENEQTAFIIGALARIDKKVDYLLEMNSAKIEISENNEFEEEFDI